MNSIPSRHTFRAGTRLPSQAQHQRQPLFLLEAPRASRSVKQLKRRLRLHSVASAATSGPPTTSFDTIRSPAGA
eukprot:6551029-Pyramimonas_sp.AAC.1